jgi:hypothetical protein
LTVGWKARVPVVAAALWWGSLTAIGFVAVPLLFATLATPAMAGQMAAKLFTAQTWVSVVSALMILMAARSGDEPARMDWGNGAIAEFAVAPRIVARQDLALWHSVGTVFYAVQWACAITVLWKLTLPRA